MRCGKYYEKGLGRPAIAGDSPVSESSFPSSGILSKAGSETPRLNPAAPSAKAKYSRKTDSERVP